MNPTEEKLLSLLGSGVSAASAASTLGITESAVSQYLSQEEFAAKVVEKRYESLSAHTARDRKYDSLEDSLISRLQEALPLLYKPRDILAAIQTVNNAKRRGSSSPEQLVQQATVINLTLPTTVVEQFTINQQGQVVSVGEKSMLTIQSGSLRKLRNDSDTLPSLAATSPK